VVTTHEVAELLRAASLPVVLHENASGPLADLPVPGRGEIVIVVGPEGGITDEELTEFAAVGAEPVRLGSSVLRSSTAGVAATAALLARSRWR
jgi:16S rRNA (uracil1498-N3)-methyltransferase